MYKKFFMGIAAMAALTLVSCSSDDLNSLSDNSSKNEAISFDGYLGRSAVAVNGSRGSVETKDQLKTDGFGVFSTYTGDDQSSFSNFANQKVTCPGTKWTYSPLKFWPTQGKINFFAYAPYVENKTLNNTSFEFTVENRVADQKDLLWANAKDQTKENISNTGNKVKFQFAHALSRLGYTVKLYQSDPSNATFKLKKITLAGSADGTAGTFYTEGTIDLSKTSTEDPWTTKGTNKTKQKFDWDYSTNPLVLSNKETKNTDKEYLFVIPQNFSQDGNTLYVIVEYTIQYTGVTEPITNKVYKQITQNFEKGKAYMINLTIGRPIEFDADVTEWGKDNPYDIDSWEYNK